MTTFVILVLAFSILFTRFAFRWEDGLVYLRAFGLVFRSVEAEDGSRLRRFCTVERDRAYTFQEAWAARAAWNSPKAMPVFTFH